MPDIDLQADALKPWAQVVKEREIRECKRCTSIIANNRSYGRPPQPSDPNLCECCPPIRYGLDNLRFYQDGGHGWLEVPTADVNESGYRPSEFSYRHDTYTPEVKGQVSTLINSHIYLEEDVDIRGFIEATGIAPADVVDYVSHISMPLYIEQNPLGCWIRDLPHCSGLGHVSPFKGGLVN